MSAVEASGLHKRLGGKPVLDGLDLSVPPGAVFGLLGRNGAGKTTLYTLLLGLARPDRGRAAVLGENLATVPAARRRVGYVAEGEIFPGWVALADVMQLERRLRDAWDETALRRWLAAERLAPRRRVRHLSKGQRKRFELELVLAGQPAVLLLDEPFSGLDPVAKSEILEALLGHIVASGATALLSSHVLPDLERVCEHVGVLAGGRLAVVVSMDELKESGGIVMRPGAVSGAALPVEMRVLTTRRAAEACTWSVTGLDGDRQEVLTRAGYQVLGGSLEEMGTELIRALDACTEERHV